MGLHAAVNAWTSRYIESSEARLARLTEAKSSPDEKRRGAIAKLVAAIAPVRRHRAAFELGLKAKK